MNQTPYERAALWHRVHCPHVPFVQVVEAHFYHGYVVSTRALFVLARRVRHDWSGTRLLDIGQTDPAGDCWHVWLFAGELPQLPAADMLRLPWVTFHRGQRVVRLRAPRASEFLAGKWTERSWWGQSRAHGKLCHPS
jgi:hypothetical protein